MSKDKDRELLKKITEAANLIAKKGREAQGNHIMLSTENAEKINDYLDVVEKREKKEKNFDFSILYFYRKITTFAPLCKDHSKASSKYNIFVLVVCTNFRSMWFVQLVYLLHHNI